MNPHVPEDRARRCDDDDAVRAVVEATDPAPNPTPPPAVTAEQLRHRAERKDQPR